MTRLLWFATPSLHRAFTCYSLLRGISRRAPCYALCSRTEGSVYGLPKGDIHLCVAAGCTGIYGGSYLVQVQPDNRP